MQVVKLRQSPYPLTRRFHLQLLVHRVSVRHFCEAVAQCTALVPPARQAYHHPLTCEFTDGRQYVFRIRIYLHIHSLIWISLYTLPRVNALAQSLRATASRRGRGGERRSLTPPLTPVTAYSGTFIFILVKSEFPRQVQNGQP